MDSVKNLTEYTDKEIFEHSKLFSNFLGGKKEGHLKDYLFYFNDFKFTVTEEEPDYRGGTYIETDYNRGYCKVSQMEFHCNWDWLMAVVEDIEDYDYKDSAFYAQINYNSCTIWDEVDLLYTSEAKIEKTKYIAVYNACLNFINWINLQK